jgi:regulation of enolase protein 1 (concanavalin A-like superfamily)
VAKVVVCPSCQSKGSIPDDAQPARIRCPKCKQVFDTGGASQSSAGPAKRPVAANAKRPAAEVSSALDDTHGVQALPTLSSSSSGARRPTAVAALKSSGQSPMMYAILGVGGLAVLLLLGVLVIVLTRGGGEPADRVDHVEVVRKDSPAPVIEPVAAVTPAGATVVATSSEAESVPVATSSGAEGVPAVSSASSNLDSAEIVRRLKEATVYLKHKVNNITLGSGTGFVIEVRGDTVVLATNRHVAVFDRDEVPESVLPKGSKVEFEAVFRSGLGPQKEQTLPATIIAADTSEEFSTDLAILAVKGVKNPPTPLSVFAKSDTTEGMAYQGAGFPLGGMLGKITESKGNPSVTITRGGIAALRRDDHGHVDLFQVDGSLQPGNSGGPIVEEKTGKLIGVAVAKVGSVDTIGFVVPADELRRTLAGKVGALDLTLKSLAAKNASLVIKAEIVDPKGAVQNVMVHVAPASGGSISPNGDGSWPPLPNTTGVELKRDPKLAMASGDVQVSLTGEGAAARKILIQTAHRDNRGKLVYSKPREIDLPEKPGRVAVSGQMLKLLKTVQRKSFSMLGPLIDPEKDCKLTKSDDDLKIKIDVPGGKVRSLAPYIVNRLNKKKPLHNAPMSLVDVDGDFAALVEVTGDISAGTTLPKDRQGNAIPFTFQSAGLLLYQDKDNFVRIERSAGVAVETLQPIHKVLFEVVKDGQQVPNEAYPAVQEGPVSLLLMRRKGKVMVGASFNLGSPPQAFRMIELDLPTKVKVGLSASNISAKPFTANFENFALFNNVTQIDAMFSEPTPEEQKRK